MFDKLPALPKPLPTPQSLPVADKLPAVPDSFADVADLQLVQLPHRHDGVVIDWSAPLREAWDISESGALAIMEQFLSEGETFPGAKPAAMKPARFCSLLVILGRQLLLQRDICVSDRPPPLSEEAAGRTGEWQG